MHFTRYVTKIDFFLFPGCDQLFFGLLGPTIREMGIPFEIFFFRFSSRFSFFGSLNRFFPTVSAVIDQLICDNFCRILHALGYQMIPGFAHLHLKVKSR